MYTDEFVTEIVKHYGKTEKDLKSAALGIAEVVRRNAENYYIYGPYWWAVKDLIKKYVHTSEWFTGDYMDYMTLETAWHGTELRTICAAVNYQDEQIMQTPCHSVLINGQECSYTLYDEDAGF